MSDKNQDDTEPEDQPSRRGALIAMVAVIILVLAGIGLTHLLAGTSKIQDCVMAGRSNCAPIRTGG